MKMENAELRIINAPRPYAWRPVVVPTNPSTPLSIKENFQHFYLYNQIR